VTDEATPRRGRPAPARPLENGDDRRTRRAPWKDERSPPLPSAQAAADGRRRRDDRRQACCCCPTAPRRRPSTSATASPWCWRSGRACDRSDQGPAAPSWMAHRRRSSGMAVVRGRCRRQAPRLSRGPGRARSAPRRGRLHRGRRERPAGTGRGRSLRSARGMLRSRLRLQALMVPTESAGGGPRLLARVVEAILRAGGRLGLAGRRLPGGRIPGASMAMTDTAVSRWLVSAAGGLLPPRLGDRAQRECPSRPGFSLVVPLQRGFALPPTASFEAADRRWGRVLRSSRPRPLVAGGEAAQTLAVVGTRAKARRSRALALRAVAQAGRPAGPPRRRPAPRGQTVSVIGADRDGSREILFFRLVAGDQRVPVAARAQEWLDELAQSSLGRPRTRGPSRPAGVPRAEPSAGAAERPDLGSYRQVVHVVPM